MRTIGSSLVLSVVLASSLTADDWPQWMGPERDSVWRESGIVETIPEEGLPIVWRTKIGLGYSGPAVADGRVYVTDFVKSSGRITNNAGSADDLVGVERVHCLDARSGESLWTREDERKYALSYPGGPRATPTVDGDRVYTLGAMGDLLCLSTADGRLLWSKSFTEDYGAPVPIWGFAGHPLVHGDLLICLVGGEGRVAMAFDKGSGKEVWRSLTAGTQGYCPPIVVEQGGREVLLIWDPSALNGLDPATGKVHWSVPLKPSYGMSIGAPRKVGDVLFACGIGNTAAAVELNADGTKAEVLWRGTPRTAVYCSNSTPFVDASGTIFGCDVETSQLVAARLSDGERLWGSYEPIDGERGVRHATAFIVQQGDRYWLFNDQGDLVLARMDAKKYDEIGRMHVLAPTNFTGRRKVVWTHPAFADRAVFVRNDEEIVRVDAAAK